MENDDQKAPRHPGRILFERVMQPLGISRNQLARDIDVPVGRISDITNGKRGITADTALRLGRYFGVAPDIWLRLQAEFDLHQARTTTWRHIEPRVRILTGRKTAPAGPAPADTVPLSDSISLLPDLPAAPLAEQARSDGIEPAQSEEEGEEVPAIPPRPDEMP